MKILPRHLRDGEFVTEKVVDMKGKPAQVAAKPVNEDIVKMLRELLASAEAGELVQFAAAWQEDNGAAGDCSVSPADYCPHVLIGGLEVCKATLIAGLGGAEKPFA